MDTETIPDNETEGNASRLDQNICQVIPGQKLPAEILDTVLRAQDRRTISLREILAQSQDGVLACVYTKGSKMRFQEEFSRLAGCTMYPHIRLTYIGISGYPPSINVTVSRYAEEDEPEFILSDRAQTRFSHEGPIRRGFFIIKKDTTLFVKRTGTLEGVFEGIARAKARFHKEWTDERTTRGLPKMPW